MPKILFCYKNENEWKTIGDAIKRKMDPDDPYECKLYSKYIFIDEDILIVPLFGSGRANGDINPDGLEIVKHLRSKGYYSFRTIFIVTSDENIPSVFNPHRAMYVEAKDIIKNPAFKNTRKAFLLGEIKNNKNGSNQTEIVNILNINGSNFIENLKNLIARKDLIGTESRIMYYDIFLNFYKPFSDENTIQSYLNNIGDEDKNKLASILTEADINSSTNMLPLLDFANEIYNHLNGTGQLINTAHRVKYELFRAPIPFPLQEMTDARLDVKNILDKKGAGTNKIKLLLIDNKADKFCNNGGEKTIKKVLDNFGVDDLFEIGMLGGKKHGPDFQEDYEKFDFRRFSNSKDLLREDESEYHKIFLEKYKLDGKNITYRELVYRKIKDAHFILLDFFLDNDNIYLAFDFIKDICDTKKVAEDYSTTWFFITSAVHDSVVKYSQSGLLAEYYESAVVSAGDDPTNPKRQIIFIYKLLTFIKARLATFNSYKTSIEGLLGIVKSEENHGGRQQISCKDYGKNPSLPCDREKCLRNIQIHIKRYLTEFDDVASIFYDSGKEEISVVIESIDNLINQFIWLPEADWYIIQHQVDFINEKLKKLDDEHLKKSEFSCGYILKELRNRSEAY